MLEVYTIYGGEMWKYAFDAVVGILGNRTWITLLRICGTFAIVGILFSFIKTRNPMMFVQWLAIFVLVTSVMLVPKRSVQIIDVTDQAAVWRTDNVPVGLAAIASLTSSIGYKVAQLYDLMFARPDSVTYTKSGMLFGSQIVAETSDIRTQNPELAQMLPDYVENCVIGDILLNHKYTVNELLNTTDPLGLITSEPSPLRGIYKTSSDAREFLTCAQAATQIKTLTGTDSQANSATFAWLTNKIYGNKLNGASLLATAMGQSYGYFYSGGMTAAQVMKNNITNSAIRQGIRGFAARSSDTANLLNLATESAATKQRLSWAAGSVMATRTLPFAQSLLMLILVCLFPLVIALAAANHSLFGLHTLKLYVCGFLYFQMWPVMFAILNYAATFWLQSKTGGTALVLSNTDEVALQHSDVANLAGYLSLSIPLLSFYLTKGAAAIGSQVAGSVFSSMAFGSAGVASTAADGNWSFNNMSMDNLNQNKMDTNLSQRQGQQTWQGSNGSTLTQTASGMNVIDGSGAMSNLPVNMKLSQLASSGFQEQARISQANAQTALDGYNHSVTSGWNQLSQVANQTGSSDSLSKGTDNSQTTNITTGTSKMMSAVESYAKSNNISTQEAFNELMTKSSEASTNAGASARISSADQVAGKALALASGVSGEAHVGGELKGSTGKSHGTQSSGSTSIDNRHDKNSQMVEDFRQGRDMVTSSRVTDSGNHTDNASTSNLQQFAATLSDAKSQYQQYTTSQTRSDEQSRLASLAQNQSASLDTNYTQEFVNWSTAKYGDRTQDILTNAPSARVAAAEFVQERLEPEIMGDYQQGRQDLRTGDAHQPYTLPIGSPRLQQDNSGPVYSPVPGHNVTGGNVPGVQSGQGNYPYTPGAAPYTAAPGQSGGGSPVYPVSQGQPVEEQRYPSGNTNPSAVDPVYSSGHRTQSSGDGGGYYASGAESVTDRRQEAQGGQNPSAYPQNDHYPRTGGAQRADANGTAERSSSPGHSDSDVDAQNDYRGDHNNGNQPFINETGSHRPLMPDGQHELSGSQPTGNRPNIPGTSGPDQHLPQGRHEVSGSRTAGSQQNTRNPAQNNVDGSSAADNTLRASGPVTQPGRPSQHHEPVAGAEPNLSVQQTLDAHQSGLPGTQDSQNRNGGYQDSHGTPGGAVAPRQEGADGNVRMSGNPLPVRGPGSSSLGNNVPGRDIAGDYRSNKELITAPLNNTFPGQTALAQKVAEERSTNERNINNSAGEIGKKESTVQASSGTLGEEYSNAQAKFIKGHEEEKANQKLIPRDAEQQDIDARLKELRRRAG